MIENWFVVVDHRRGYDASKDHLAKLWDHRHQQIETELYVSKRHTTNHGINHLLTHDPILRSIPVYPHR